MKIKLNNCLIALLGLFSTSAFAQQVQWEQFFPFGVPTDPTVQPIVAVHLIHVTDGNTGKFLAFTYAEPSEPGQECDPACTSTCRGKIYLWTPSQESGNPGQFQSIPLCENYVFCSGHTALADGRILVVGGQALLPRGELFNPGLPFDPLFAWNFPSAPNPMAQARWYPTATTLWDGSVLVTSGTTTGANHGTVVIPELYNPVTNVFTQVPSAAIPVGEALYPWMFVLPNGNLVKAGWGGARILDTHTDPWEWGAFIQNPTFPNPPNGPAPPWDDGSAVMYEPGKIMICGGGDPAVTTTFVIDLNNADAGNPPPWLFGGNMHHPRRNLNLVPLPDGKILAVGGNERSNAQGQPIDPVFAAEIYDPSAGTWTEQPLADVPRMYHSTAALLADGRVVSAGGNGNPTAQIFKPPYLMGNPPPPRPSILTAPTYMQYGQPYAITYNQNGGPVVSKACLIRLASVTHAFDQNQRYVPLTITPDPNPGTDPSIVVTAPAGGTIAPPGYYMLFILNEYARNQYAPSVAKYVKVGS